ncbi:hypothetical protein DSM21852_39870 [Methylocystis bryophila]|uniref:Uncharacterized protein n=1 Tax=Methylocystis bryophila TaxID=655015 RepID=A0A1W6MSY0_9HYPH|nr:hypothetical protein B1812_05810 [Methylocystis bryophila]BDV40734.1 hypothetical protein DSM21852_39870 [Methylocystis bryophila]
MKTRKLSIHETPDEERLGLKLAEDRFGQLLLRKGSTELLQRFVAIRKVNQELDGTGRDWRDDALDAELARRRRRFN